MLVIRLSRTGRTKQPYYRVVVADRRSAADSGAIEVLGHYNPRTKEVVIDVERAKVRLAEGAQPSETAAMLLEKSGAMKREKITDKNRRPARSPRKEQPEEENAASSPASAGDPSATEAENAEAEQVVEAEITKDTAEEAPATEKVPEAEAASPEETPSESGEASSDDESAEKKE